MFVRSGEEMEKIKITDPINGLSEEEVNKRKSDGRVNGDPNVKTKSVKRIFFDNIFTFFNLMNIVLVVMVMLVGSPKNAMFGLVIVCNTAIGIIQELRAKRTIDRLTLISAPKAHVIRGGKETEIPTAEIVADELVIFRTGMQAAADCTIVSGECEVNESLITGESDPVFKKIGKKILSGSFIVSGEVRAVVTALGTESFSSKITAGAKYFKKNESKMLGAINTILKGISICIIPVMALLIYNAVFVTEQPFNRAVTSSVAAIIGMIPEGLVLLTSVVLAVSSIRLAQNRTLVQDLYCIETLARVDTLCLDKTGTITEGTMAIDEIEPLFDISDEKIDELLNALMSSLSDVNPTACAMREKWSLGSKYSAERVIPFSSAKKWSGAYFREFGSLIMGAGEFILGDEYEKIRNKSEKMSEGGRRVILLARSEKSFNNRDLPENIVPLALIAITDKLRPEARDTLRYFDEQGVDIRIISGDNPKTVSAVAVRAGVKNAEKYIDASTVADISTVANDYTVFGRVTPEQKLAIIKSLKAQGKTVGMTGDGVNDVLALKEADCSIAMQSGSEAARNVSNLVLLDSNFASMPMVVAEGRRAINNVERSASLFLSKTIYSLLLAVMFIIIRQPYLFEPIQMTLINALCIGIPSFFLGLQENKSLIRGSFIANVMEYAAPNGISAVLALSAVLICTAVLGFSTAQMSTLATIVLAAVSFMITIRCCKPWKPWKMVMMPLLIAAFCLGNILFPEFFCAVPVTFEMGICAIGIVAGAAGLMVLLSKLSHKIVHCLREKRAGKL